MAKNGKMTKVALNAKNQPLSIPFESPIAFPSPLWHFLRHFSGFFEKTRDFWRFQVWSGFKTHLVLHLSIITWNCKIPHTLTLPTVQKMLKHNRKRQIECTPPLSNDHQCLSLNGPRSTKKLATHTHHEHFWLFLAILATFDHFWLRLAGPRRREDK